MRVRLQQRPAKKAALILVYRPLFMKKHVFNFVLGIGREKNRKKKVGRKGRSHAHRKYHFMRSM